MDLNSIRNRYALLSIAGGCLVIMVAGLANFLVDSTRQESALNIENRHILLSHSRAIRDSIWSAREAIGHFLIDPQRVENQTLIHAAIGEAINSTESLLDEKDKLSTQQYEKIRSLLETIYQLDDAALNLIHTRLSAQSQYPSLSHATEHMLPRQRAIINQLGYAIRETQGQINESPETLNLFLQLVELRHKWLSTISGNRMLIASRLGSLGTASLQSQVANMKTYIEGVKDDLRALNSHIGFDYLGLATEHAIEELNHLVPEWEESYRQLLVIHNSDEWRSDIRPLRHELDPVLNEIWNTLSQFDAALSKSAEKDVQEITQLAQNQSYIIWSIATLAVVFIIIGFISLDRFLLLPISLLTRALFREAHGERSVEIPKYNSTETKNLLEAFQTMRNLVGQRQSALVYQALHDSLTNLPNRTLLYERLNNLMSTHSRKDDHHILIIMDLDRFKEINDNLGHQTGDQLLIAVSVRLRYLLRETDLIARLGGDEFAMLLPHTTETEARQVARKILKAFESPYQVHEHELYVGASLGIAAYPNHGNDAENLIKRADAAMYVAKRNRLGYSFSEGTDNVSDVYLNLAGDLRAAVNNEQLTVHYQLKYDMQTNYASGAECLLRWNHPEHGNVSPVDIIPMAEQLGIINRITLWVIEQALLQCRQWRDQGIFLGVAVNLSVYDLQTTEIVNQIQHMLIEHDIPPSYLTVEITEGAMLIEPENAIEILNKLDKIGVTIAIDDFGSGFSSLGYLKQLPVDELKIDKSFVMDMITDDNDAVIVRSTIDLAHNLGLDVVAEGVESKDIFLLLSILDCDTAQGFYMCKPVPAGLIPEFLEINVDYLAEEDSGKTASVVSN